MLHIDVLFMFSSLLAFTDSWAGLFFFFSNNSRCWMYYYLPMMNCTKKYLVTMGWMACISLQSVWNEIGCQRLYKKWKCNYFYNFYVNDCLERKRLNPQFYYDFEFAMATKTLAEEYFLLRTNAIQRRRFQNQQVRSP